MNFTKPMYEVFSYAATDDKEVKVKMYSNPITGLDRPINLEKVQAPRFQDNRHMKVVRLSALRTGRLYLQGILPGTHFC
jgi:hypothetical protein